MRRPLLRKHLHVLGICRLVEAIFARNDLWKLDASLFSALDGFFGPFMRKPLESRQSPDITTFSSLS